MNEWNKRQIWGDCEIYDRNENLGKTKKQEKANNILIYRFAAFNKVKLKSPMVHKNIVSIAWNQIKWANLNKKLRKSDNYMHKTPQVI